MNANLHDTALLPTTRPGAEKATQECHLVNGAFGLSVNIPKTKLMVTGREVTEEDKTPMTVNGSEIESVSFRILDL